MFFPEIWKCINYCSFGHSLIVLALCDVITDTASYRCCYRVFWSLRYSAKAVSRGIKPGFSRSMPRYASVASKARAKRSDIFCYQACQGTLLGPTPPHPTRNTDVRGIKMHRTAPCLWEVRSKKCALSPRPSPQHISLYSYEPLPAIRLSVSEISPFIAWHQAEKAVLSMVPGARRSKRPVAIKGAIEAVEGRALEIRGPLWLWTPAMGNSPSEHDNVG